MPPLPPEEVIRELRDAVALAQKTKRELAEERAAALDVLKKQRHVITDAIVAEVQTQVGELADAAREDLRARAGALVESIAADMRAKLGL